MTTPKAIIFDLDGTLALSKAPLSLPMAKVLADLLEYVPISIVSGASFGQFTKQFLPFLPPATNLERLYLFPVSSAECFSYKGGSWQVEYDHSFNSEEREKIISALKKAMIEVGLPQVKEYGEQIEDRGAQITLSCLGQHAPLEFKAKWDPNQEKRKIIRDKLLEIIPEFEINIGGATSIDVTKKGVTKATSINWLKNKLNITPSDMLYVGDALFAGGNDSAVVGTGIQVKQVEDPSETGLIAVILDDVLKHLKK